MDFYKIQFSEKRAGSGFHIEGAVSQSISFPLSVPIQFAEINTSPPTTDDRTIFSDIDISLRFYSFKQDVNNHTQQGIAIIVEEYVQHLLALSSILLLKPASTHKDLYKHIELNTCDALCQHIIEKHKMTNQSFPTEVKLQLEKIMMQLEVDGDQGFCCPSETLEKLPRRIIENGPKETELITRHLEAILSPLFEDLDNSIAFRWTSISDDEKQANIRPDASINIMHGALFHRLVGIDLVRVATLAKDTSDKHKLKYIFAFLVVGKNATFYIINRAKTDLYTMCEIAHIQLPFSLDQVSLFISQLNKVIKVVVFSLLYRMRLHFVSLETRSSLLRSS
ncbi:hypothetical protein G6F56_004083 [Rhizopus delemar]|nr:hypothetical protein G6F56_004083 [Rhizopus delemar]